MFVLTPIAPIDGAWAAIVSMSSSPTPNLLLLPPRIITRTGSGSTG
jgi:hypothetical protein